MGAGKGKNRRVCSVKAKLSNTYSRIYDQSSPAEEKRRFKVGDLMQTGGQDLVHVIVQLTPRSANSMAPERFGYDFVTKLFLKDYKAIPTTDKHGNKLLGEYRPVYLRDKDLVYVGSSRED